MARNIHEAGLEWLRVAKVAWEIDEIVSRMAWGGCPGIGWIEERQKEVEKAVVPIFEMYDDSRKSIVFSLPEIVERILLVRDEVTVYLDLSDNTPEGIRRIQCRCEEIVQGEIIPILEPQEEL